MNKQPSLIKIVTTDYIAFMSWLFPVVAWIMYLIFFVGEKIENNYFNLSTVYTVITIIAILTLIWRVYLINTIFNDGIEVSATINNISLFRDRGRVDYVYMYQDKKLLSGNAIHKTKSVESLKIGDQVVVMVDRNNPKRAFIRDLYI